jgi:hypothetical protein
MTGLFTAAIRQDVEAQGRVRAWIAALRSGEYVQGTHRLRNNDDTYCCLGVACDRHDRGLWHLAYSGWVYESEGHRGTVAMPATVRDTLCLVDGLGAFNNASLGAMNDHGATFAEIADFVEAHLAEAIA